MENFVDYNYSRMRWLSMQKRFTKHALMLGQHLAENLELMSYGLGLWGDDGKEHQMLIQIVYVFLDPDFSIEEGINPQKVCDFWNNHPELSL